MKPFYGFTSDTLEFLHRLDANNCKEWLEAHQEEYRQNLLEPLHQLAAVLAGQFGVIDHNLITEPRRVVSLLHCNTCFSRDKSLNKTTMRLTFKQPHISWQDAPLFFFELSANAYRYGMGFCNASRITMDWLRKSIIEYPDSFRHMITFLSYQKTFSLTGDRHKGHANSHPEWHQRKSLYLVCNRKIDDRLFSRQIVYELATGFALLAPMYHWLWQLKDVELFSFHKYP